MGTEYCGGGTTDIALGARIVMAVAGSDRAAGVCAVATCDGIATCASSNACMLAIVHFKAIF